MNGFDVLWQPGQDHAGIATQMVVERELEKNNKNRQEIGRKRFLEEVWKWKEKSGNTIIDQLKRLGASCDWSRNRFTMDPDFHKAVIKVFFGVIFFCIKSKNNYMVFRKGLAKHCFKLLYISETISSKGSFWPYK